MLAIELLVTDWPESADATCCVTGRQTLFPVASKKLFGKTFTDFPLLAVPAGQWVDARIAEILGNNRLSWQSWVVVGGALHEAQPREAVAQILRCGFPSYPAACYVAEDMRRKGALLTHACREETPHVQFGLARADLNRASRLYTLALKFYEAGWGKGNLLDLTTPSKAPGDLLADWRRVQGSMAGHSQTPEWRLAIWALPSKEKP